MECGILVNENLQNYLFIISYIICTQHIIFLKKKDWNSIIGMDKEITIR